jgi:hypothetical protein
MQLPPLGTRVRVGVALGVLVGVVVGVPLGVTVAVLVAVAVVVAVAVRVPVAVAVAVTVAVPVTVLVAVTVGVSVGVPVGVVVGVAVGVAVKVTHAHVVPVLMHTMDPGQKPFTHIDGNENESHDIPANAGLCQVANQAAPSRTHRADFTMPAGAIGVRMAPAGSSHLYQFTTRDARGSTSKKTLQLSRYFSIDSGAGRRSFTTPS